MVQLTKSDNQSFFFNAAATPPPPPPPPPPPVSSAVVVVATTTTTDSTAYKYPSSQHTPTDSTHHQQVNLLEKLQNLPPLELKLKISSTLVQQLESILTPQSNNPTTRQSSDFVSQQITEKMKASNFPASVLRIGSWERVCVYEGDLVAKCYYAKKKLVWEFLESSLKRKIEIQWADILAIRATIRENEPGILELELNQPPAFYHETDPQPRKHTNWRVTTDFTQGQAPLWRRHYLKCPPGVLDRHYEKLLQCDNRLFELSHKPFPSLESPYFQTSLYGIHEFSLNFNQPRSQIYRNLHYPQQFFPAQNYFPAQQIQPYQPTIQHSFGFKDSASPSSADNQRMAFWGGQATENNFAATECIARNQVQGQFTTASTPPTLVPYQTNNCIESGNMQQQRQRSLDPHQMVIDNLKQTLMTDSEIEYLDQDEEYRSARIASFGALIDQSTEGNLGRNHPENYVLDMCNSLEHSNDTAQGQLYPQPISWMTPQITDDIDNQSVSWPPHTPKIPMSQFRSSSSSFFPTTDDFSTHNNNDGVNRWP